MSEQSNFKHPVPKLSENEQVKYDALHAPRQRSAYGSIEDNEGVPADLLKAMDDEALEENPFLDEDDGVVVIIRKTTNENNNTVPPIATPIPPFVAPQTAIFSPVTALSSTVSAFSFDKPHFPPAVIPPLHTTPFKEPNPAEERLRRQSEHDRHLRALRSLTKRRPNRRGDDSD